LVRHEPTELDLALMFRYLEENYGELDDELCPFCETWHGDRIAMAQPKSSGPV
jgi:hypothetical protein